MRNPRLGASGRMLTNLYQPRLLLMDPPPTQESSQPQPKRRRRAQDGQDDAPATSPGTRRLRRSHEACARCRSKKIKASSVGLARRQFPLTPCSAIPSTLAAPPVLLLGLRATKRIVIGRRLLLVVIQNALNDNCFNARHYLKRESPILT